VEDVLVYFFNAFSSSSVISKCGFGPSNERKTLAFV